MLNGGGRAWIRPEHFPDSVERLAELGRGSPTGVLAYRHRQFPERYRRGAFMACWSLGTIYFVPPDTARLVVRRRGGKIRVHDRQRRLRAGRPGGWPAGPSREAAARRLLAVAENSSSPAAWSPELVETVGLALPATEALARLRPKADDPRLRDAVTTVIVSQGHLVDRDRLIAALATSTQPALVEKIAAALVARPAGSLREIGAALKALGRHAGTPATALALDRLLAAWTDREPMSKTGGITQNLFSPWFARFSTATQPKRPGWANTAAPTFRPG